MKQSKFDIVMDYIDESINLDPDTIKSGILNLIGINSERFGHFFNVLTGDTLGNYIRNRRLYFAVNDLRKRHDKSISDIAYDYGYSDQSAFTRAITAKYNISPLRFVPPGDQTYKTRNTFFLILIQTHRICVATASGVNLNALVIFLVTIWIILKKFNVVTGNIISI